MLDIPHIHTTHAEYPSRVRVRAWGSAEMQRALSTQVTLSPVLFPEESPAAHTCLPSQLPLLSHLQLLLLLKFAFWTLLSLSHRTLSSARTRDWDTPSFLQAWGAAEFFRAGRLSLRGLQRPHCGETGCCMTWGRRVWRVSMPTFRSPKPRGFGASEPRGSKCPASGENNIFLRKGNGSCKTGPPSDLGSS